MERAREMILEEPALQMGRKTMIGVLKHLFLTVGQLPDTALPSGAQMFFRLKAN